ncbi:MAG: hypothetical protein WCP32_07390 [Bacteroidota bacterium]
MKSLLFGSLCCIFFLTGCVSVKPKGIKPSIENQINHKTNPILFVNSLFKATLEIKKRRLSGLLLIKRMDTAAEGISSKGSVYRVVFTNEIGMTFFDLELTSDSGKMISCFASFNKKAFIKILKTDFQVLTNNFQFESQRTYRQDSTRNLIIYGIAGSMKIWQVYSPTADTLFKVAGKSTIADPVFISFTNYSNNRPAKITVENPVIGMKLSLRLLSKP